VPAVKSPDETPVLVAGDAGQAAHYWLPAVNV
jgi:hypothetical protein